MRLLIYAMQSSGASTLAMLLAQNLDCAAFVDVWAQYAAPSLPMEKQGDVVVKVVVTTAFPLALHQERFRPDCTVLFLRHPVSNGKSLATKPYRHHCGFMEEKFALLDSVFADPQGIDAILYYEDLVCAPLGVLAAIRKLGWSCDRRSLRLSRDPRDITKCNESRFPSIVGRLEYGTGNWHSGALTRKFANRPGPPIPDISAWCPKLSEHYRVLATRKRRWQAMNVLT